MDASTMARNSSAMALSVGGGAADGSNCEKVAENSRDVDQGKETPANKS
jgi:hypothetical protein